MIVVVGGHTRNIGKTTLATQILAATPGLHWTAMKITQYGHGVCSANGEACDCATADHTIAISEERRRDTGTDTSRMLAAGADRVLWVRTQQGQLVEAMPRLRSEMAKSTNLLLKSNSVLRFLRPDLYAAVLDPTVVDFKESASRYLDRADALFVPKGSLEETAWGRVSPALLRNKPVFALAEEGLSEEARQWMLASLGAGVSAMESSRI